MYPVYTLTCDSRTREFSSTIENKSILKGRAGCENVDKHIRSIAVAFHPVVMFSQCTVS